MSTGAQLQNHEDFLDEDKEFAKTKKKRATFANDTKQNATFGDNEGGYDELNNMAGF